MKTKTVYQLNEYGILTGETDAIESPLEPGIFHVPHNCVDTTDVPPSVKFPSYAYWEDGWKLGEYAVQDDTPTPEALERAWRDAELKRADVELLKVQDGMPNLGNVSDWRKYRVALRNWPNDSKFPDSEYRPVAPTL